MKLLFYNCLLYVLVLSAYGQASGGGDKKVWVMSTSIPEGMENPLKIKSGEKVHDVKIFRRSFDRPVKVSKDEVFAVVKEMKDAEGKVVYRQLGAATIPEGVSEVLAVLIPSRNFKTNERFSVKIIDLENFRGGDTLYINLTKVPLGVTLDGKKTLVKPSGISTVSVIGGRDKAAVAYQYYYQNPTDKEWKFMNGSKKAIYKSQRDICVFFANPKTRNIDYRGIVLRVPTKKDP